MAKKQNKTLVASQVDATEATPQTAVVQHNEEVIAEQSQIAELERQVEVLTKSKVELEEQLCIANQQIADLDAEKSQLSEALKIAHESVVNLEAKEEAVQKEIQLKAENEGTLLPSFETPAGEVIPTKKFANIDGTIYNFTKSQELEGSIRFCDLDEEKRGNLVRKYPHIFKLKK